MTPPENEGKNGSGMFIPARGLPTGLYGEPGDADHSSYPFRKEALPGDTAGGRPIERFVYVFLIYGSEICLIDSGVAGSERRIFDYIRRTGRRPEESSLLVLTHAPPDHIGAVRAVRKATGCTVAAHPGERTWIEDTDRQVRERPVPGFHELVGGSVPVDRIVGDGER